MKLDHLLSENKLWADSKTQQNPDFFNRLSKQQAPKYMWIGCADSRVPANEIVNLDPGEMFVHRNVANLANPTDINCLSVLAFAINVLKVEHIIVCGHYGCGGVKTVLENSRNGLFEHWLEPVRETMRNKLDEINKLDDLDERVNLLCEMNVKSQVVNLSKNIIIEDAWKRGQSLTLHGWIYGIGNGIIQDLGVTIDGQ
ncbi:MAG: carbonic anhydrase [Alphaproteobacteria bacterium]